MTMVKCFNKTSFIVFNNEAIQRQYQFFLPPEQVDALSSRRMYPIVHSVEIDSVVRCEINLDVQKNITALLDVTHKRLRYLYDEVEVDIERLDKESLFND